MGCLNGLHITFNSGDWRPGTYLFSITAGRKTITCTSQLPFMGCDGNTRCSDPSVRIGESGCALSPDAHYFSGLSMDKVPKKFELTIRNSEGGSYSFKKDVKAKRVQPNGEGCEPTCEQAVFTLPVKFR